MTDTLSGFERPTLDQLIAEGEAVINARLPGAETRLRFNNLGVMNRVLMGGVHLALEHLERQARLILPDLAVGSALDRHANWRGVERLPARAAQGVVILAAGGQENAPIPPGTRLRRVDGVEYETLRVDGGTPTIRDGGAAIPVRALDPGGNGAAAAGIALTFVSQLPGVPGQAVVDAAGLSGGRDVEDDESLRARLRAHVQRPPHGGSADDYVLWALEWGAARAWVRPNHPTLGQVLVLFLVPPGPVQPDGLPLEGDAASMTAWLDERRPVTALTRARGPDRQAVDISLQLRPNTPEVQQAVRDELADLFLRESEPGGTILVSHIREAISTAIGERDHVLLAPTENVAAISSLALPILGSLMFGEIP